MKLKLQTTAKLLAPALCLGFLGAAQHAAQAHFLWAEINQNDVRVALSEQPGEAGVAFDKVKNSVITAGNQTLPLGDQNGKSYLAAQLPANTNVAAASNNWGVLDRTSQGRGVFLLYYYAKAARTLSDATTPSTLPAQWYAKQQGNQIVASFLQQGKPVAGAAVEIALPNGQSKETVTDANGKVLFDSAGNGLYGLKALITSNEKGVYQGKNYPGIHSYSTLTFHVANADSALPKNAAAADSENAKADPQAYSLLKDAHDHRQVNPADFPGFKSDLIINDSGKSYQGTVESRPGQRLKVDVEGLSDEQLDHYMGYLGQLIGHRKNSDFSQDDGRWPLEFVAGDVNDFGQFIKVHDKFDSKYRVKDHQIREVIRTFGDELSTVSVIQTMTTDGGNYLPIHFMEAARNLKTGQLEHVVGYRDSYAPLGDVWLPVSRTVIEFESNGTTPREIRFKFLHTELLKP
jgi:hypothetical protein